MRWNVRNASIVSHLHNISVLTDFTCWMRLVFFPPLLLFSLNNRCFFACRYFLRYLIYSPCAADEAVILSAVAGYRIYCFATSDGRFLSLLPGRVWTRPPTGVVKIINVYIVQWFGKSFKVFSLHAAAVDLKTGILPSLFSRGPTEWDAFYLHINVS